MGLPLVAWTGEEVARALVRLGFVASARDAQHAVLEKGLRRVSVPFGGTISPDALLATVRAAGVGYAELVEAIDASAFPEAKHESTIRRRR